VKRARIRILVHLESHLEAGKRLEQLVGPSAWHFLKVVTGWRCTLSTRARWIEAYGESERRCRGHLRLGSPAWKVFRSRLPLLFELVAVTVELSRVENVCDLGDIRFGLQILQFSDSHFNHQRQHHSQARSPTKRAPLNALSTIGMYKTSFLRLSGRCLKTKLSLHTCIWSSPHMLLLIQLSDPITHLPQLSTTMRASI
jgi:hypothetical protein